MGFPFEGQVCAVTRLGGADLREKLVFIGTYSVTCADPQTSKARLMQTSGPPSLILWRRVRKRCRRRPRGPRRAGRAWVSRCEDARCVPAVTNPMPSPRTATSARIPADPGALGRRLTRLTSRAALMLAQIESFLPGVPAAKLMNVGDEIVEVDGVVDLLNCLSGSSKP